VTVVHVNRERYRVLRVEVADLWCFGCRKPLPHNRSWMYPVNPLSYYGVHEKLECSGCGNDRTRFGS
jgi:hypothetical protein